MYTVFSHLRKDKVELERGRRRAVEMARDPEQFLSQEILSGLGLPVWKRVGLERHETSL